MAQLYLFPTGSLDAALEASREEAAVDDTILSTEENLFGDFSTHAAAFGGITTKPWPFYRPCMRQGVAPWKRAEHFIANPDRSRGGC